MDSGPAKTRMRYGSTSNMKSSPQTSASLADESDTARMLAATERNGLQTGMATI
ncbi:hypothetical protein LINGRAHAP2_LOCUS20149 [Linum grandiflorum]